MTEAEYLGAICVRRPRMWSDRSGWLPSRRWFFHAGKCVAFWRST